MIIELNVFGSQLSGKRLHGDRRLNQGLLSPRGSASVDPRTNILIVRDIREKLDEVKALLATLDIAVRQVLIEIQQNYLKPWME